MIQKQCGVFLLNAQLHDETSAKCFEPHFGTSRLEMHFNWAEENRFDRTAPIITSLLQ